MKTVEACPFHISTTNVSTCTKRLPRYFSTVDAESQLKFKCKAMYAWAMHTTCFSKREGVSIAL
jgi:hypothetical protein